MQKYLAFAVPTLLSALLELTVSPVAAADSISSGNLPGYSIAYRPSHDSFTDWQAALVLAGRTQRHVLVEVGGEWCSWCHLLDHFVNAEPGVRAGLHATFVVLKVNVSKENDNREFLSRFPRASGYPHMYVADASGAVLYSQDTSEFLRDGSYSRERFLEFLDRWSRAQ